MTDRDREKKTATRERKGEIRLEKQRQRSIEGALSKLPPEARAAAMAEIARSAGQAAETESGVTEPTLPEKVTHRELLAMWASLELLVDMHGANPMFTYAVVKNRKALKDEVEAINKAGETPPEYTLYDQARIALCIGHSEKDEQGNAKTLAGGQRYDIKDRKTFDEAADVLKAEHAEAIEAYEKHQKEYEAFLDEEVSLPPLKTLPMQCLPVGLVPRQVEALTDLIT